MKIRIDGCKIDGNAGHGIHLRGDADLKISGSSISKNGAGAIKVESARSQKKAQSSLERWGSLASIASLFK